MMCNKWRLAGTGIRLRRGALAMTAVLLASAALGWAGQGEEPSGEVEVIIKREAVKLTDPKTFQVAMHLEAVKSVEFTAPAAGIVRTVTAKAGQKVKRSFYIFPKHLPDTGPNDVGVIGGTFVEGATPETPNREEFERLVQGAKRFYGM